MDIETLALARAYTKASLTGAGALKGEAGKDGTSPTVTATGSTTSGALAATITDASGNTAKVYNGAKGEKGATGDKGATGETGAAGSDGADGFSPTVSITEADSSHIISITDKNGTKTTTVKDGTDSGDIPTKVSDLDNDSGFITAATTALENYYLKSDTYTQAEINTLLSNINKLTSKIVTELPTSDIDTSTIYLIQDSSNTSVYTQYMYINSEWAELGTTSVDLTDYYTKSQMNTLLAAKADTTAVPTKVSELSNDSGFLDTDGVDSEIDSKLTDYLKTETATTLLDGKVDNDDTYKAVAANSHSHDNKTVLDKLTEGTDDNSNAVLLYNGEQIASGNVKSLTKAEYDALVDAGTVDSDVVYVITDDDSTVSDELIDDTTASTTKTYSSSKIEEELGTKQDTLTFDTTPTSGSTNPVTSGGVYSKCLNRDSSIRFSSESDGTYTVPSMYSAVLFMGINTKLFLCVLSSNHQWQQGLLP